MPHDMSPNAWHNRTAELKAADTAHHFHPFMDHKELHSEGGARVIVEADGSWLTDSEGHKLIDGMSGLWNVNLGYGRKELADAAYRQMQELPYYNAFFKTTTAPAAELAKKLAEIAPAGMTHTMFGSSGSESNDTALRLVRYLWQLRGKPEKRVIIGRKWGYHGSTVSASQMGGMGIMHEQGNRLDDMHHIMPPYSFGEQREDESEEDFALRAATALEDKIKELGADRVAGFIAEPIQGAGGLIFPPEGYFRHIQRICKEYDVLLMVDEVITGFGRLGSWFASDHYGIAPDTMTIAKAVTSGYQPLSGLMVRKEIAEELYEKGGEFVHGYTYAGHPVACAVALENIRLLEEENVLARVKNDIGPYFQARLYDALNDHPLVAEIRGEGMLAAIELVENRLTRTRFPDEGTVGTICRDHCFANGLVMRAVRDTMVLAPVLTISQNDVDQLVWRAGVALDATARQLGKM